MLISQVQVTVYLLILARTLGLITSAPVLSSRNIPGSAKIALASWTALTLWFVVPVASHLPLTGAALITALAGELFIGLFLGFVGSVFLISIQSAGEMIDVQMGLSVANVFDPSFGTQISIIGRLLFLTGIFFFLSLNGHHALLSVLYNSFDLLPVSALPHIKAAYPEFLGTLGQTLWRISIQLAIPALVMLLLVDFAFGIISRVAPQVNVFMLGFQVKPTVGLLALLFMLPFFAPFFKSTFLNMSELLTRAILLLGP